MMSQIIIIIYCLVTDPATCMLETQSLNPQSQPLYVYVPLIQLSLHYVYSTSDSEMQCMPFGGLRMRLLYTQSVYRAVGATRAGRAMALLFFSPTAYLEL